ncbi:hypothetical protein RYX36_028934 [Vicia faba]
MTTTDQSTEPGATVSSPASDAVVVPYLFPAGVASRVLHDVVVSLGLLLLMELALIFSMAFEFGSSGDIFGNRDANCASDVSEAKKQRDIERERDEDFVGKRVSRFFISRYSIR